MTETAEARPLKRRSPVTEWPQADRETWRAAQATAGVLDDGGVVSHLSARTLEDLTRRYAYFLSFLVSDRETELAWACGSLGHRGKHPALRALP